jgi:signal transduction histidine kinase
LSGLPVHLVLEVHDDGDGFTPQDITNASRHGLRSMRERAELIGADSYYGIPQSKCFA